MWEIVKMYGNGWFTEESFPKDTLRANTIVIVDEINVLENITKENGVDIIYIQIEPKIVWNVTLPIIRNAYKCSTIYTYDDDILHNCKNAKKYIFGTTWIPKDYYLNINTNKKQFAASVIVGSKNINNGSGYLFRQAIYHHQYLFIETIPKIILYISSLQLPMLEPKTDNRILYDNKTDLFDNFQYSIVIDNELQSNYISEKILDCLVTQTVPIFYGCPNISEYFDTSYWIILNNTDINLLNEKINSISSTHYDNNYEKIKANYVKSMDYISLKENIKRGEMGERGERARESTLRVE